MTIPDRYPVAGQERWHDCEAYIRVASGLRSLIALLRDFSATSSPHAADPTSVLGRQIAAIKALADEAEIEMAEMLASCRREAGLIH